MSHKQKFFLSLATLLVGGSGATAEDSVADNGIHVGAPKIYDSRALTLTLDSLARSLRGTSFVDPKALAGALGNLQGFSSQDVSQGGFANAAVGPQAASVFAGGGATPAASPATTPPTVSITLAPVQNSGAATAGAASSGTVGPQPPGVPALQTAPNFNSGFGSSAGDLLSDEVNLTYQLDNVSMLLERSLSDRLFEDQPRLQAVVEFDVDIEPGADAENAAAVVDIEIALQSCQGVIQCRADGSVSLVAMMPEEGSHNAATLSQRADAFGGAIAASVFSVGYSAQSRNQVFYLYRDMDTVSFQRNDAKSRAVHFGWQFRPVLGRHTVAPGMRHMMAVVALPAADLPAAPAAAGAPRATFAPESRTQNPALTVTVNTAWTRYDHATQSTGAKASLWTRFWGGGRLPASSGDITFRNVEVPLTRTTQDDLGPHISSIKWVQGDTAGGVAVVTGWNFFPGTTVRFGGRTYSGAADGLTIKSDQQLEVALPLAAALTGGVLSGRYGQAVRLEAVDPALPVGFLIQRLDVTPAGADLYSVEAVLRFFGKDDREPVSLLDLITKVNRPVVSINGIPLSATPFLEPDGSSAIRVRAFAPGSLIEGGPYSVTVTFPFAGPGWNVTLPRSKPAINVVRLGGKRVTRLLISGNDDDMHLCGHEPATVNVSHPALTWSLQLDADRTFGVLSDAAPRPTGGALRCLQHQPDMLALDIPTADLKSYRRFVLINKEALYPVLMADVPPADPPPPGPSLDKDQKVSVVQDDVKSVTYKGKHLDAVSAVRFDKMSLRFKPADDGKSIVINLAAEVTAKPRSAELELISEGNDPVPAPLTVTPHSTPRGDK